MNFYKKNLFILYKNRVHFIILIVRISQQIMQKYEFLSVSDTKIMNIFKGRKEKL